MKQETEHNKPSVPLTYCSATLTLRLRGPWLKSIFFHNKIIENGGYNVSGRTDIINCYKENGIQVGPLFLVPNDVQWLKVSLLLYGRKPRIKEKF
ncbi:hypothetical protein QE152_g14016 [Popillia japonica]|uniref:Uncharacterized protein n=1 Tax=Popillia japonica TaxID=7064 RepID=A0AAW1LBE1_POPJA